MKIKDIINSKKPLIAAHRGLSGANIIENTIPSALCAIKSQADIVEFDVCRTLDNKVVVFHSNMEMKLFRKPICIRLLPLKIVKKIQLHSAFGGKSGYKLDTLEEYLLALKDKCVLNLDRIWNADIKKCLKAIGNIQMFDQVIIKAGANRAGKRVIAALSQYKDAYFMAICKTATDYNKISLWCQQYNVKLFAVEVVFKTQDSHLCSPDFIDKTHAKNQLLWVNTINLNGRSNMCANHGDNISIKGNPDQGWGWVIDKGFDIIQTDWPHLLKQYLLSRENR